MRDHEQRGAEEWTESERTRLNSLPRHRAPSASLKARTLSELRGRGLVRQRTGLRVSRAAWVVVAASLVFVAGGFVGYRLALTRLKTEARLATAAAESSPSDRSTNAEHVVWF